MRFTKAIVLTTALAWASAGLSNVMELPQALKDSWSKEVNSTELEYNTKTWIRTLLDGNYQDAAHNWSSVDGVLPERLTPLADATYLVLALNNELYQTSFNRMVVLLGRSSFTKSASWRSVEATLTQSYPAIINDKAVTVSKEQQAALGKLPWAGMAGVLKSFAANRGGALATDALKNETRVLPWTHRLALSAALDQAKDENLDQAIQTLSAAYKKAGDNASAKDQLALALGRMYYQKADLKTAEEWYSKISAKSPEGLTANEELLWVWLRNGNTDHLRGTAAAIESNYLTTHFMPESLVVKTISDLKLCQFDTAKRDFGAFLETNRDWAKRIDQALKAETAPLPPNADWYALSITTSLKERSKELERVKALAAESVAAAVPAVGRQKHWDDVAKDLTGHVTRLTTQQSSEYRRQWRNNSSMLREAIRKMQFVKVEMASQSDAGAKAHPESDTSATDAKKAVTVIDKAGESGWTFPADDEEWLDERLSMRSTGSSVCL